MLASSGILKMCPLHGPGEDAVSERTRKPILVTGMAVLAAMCLLLLSGRGGRYLRLA
jgi:hypothetical protein